MICEKCGKNYPDTLPKPIRCFCDTKNIVIPEYTNVKNNNITTQKPNQYSHFYQLWKELHTYEWKSEEQIRIWFEFFCARIPCGECKIHWAQLVKDFPPNEAFKSADGFFKWSVDAHNKVNKRLNKEEILFEQAVQLWKKS